MMNEKEQLWYTRFLNYANSGMSRTHWCRENGIAISSFRYWCKKFDAMRINESQDEAEGYASGWYELTCRSGSERTAQAPDQGAEAGIPGRNRSGHPDPDLAGADEDMNLRDLRSICSGKA